MAGYKNQIVITSLALLIAVVGYITYDNKISGAKETMSDKTQLAQMNFSQEDSQQIENPGETVLTSAGVDEISDYASEIKLNREQVRSKNKETLMEIINNKDLTDAEKKNAIDEMVKLTELAEKEAAAEMMLESKGFNNVVVSIDGDSCDVVLDMGEVTDSKMAQVEDIVKRKTKISADKIVITTINDKAKAQKD